MRLGRHSMRVLITDGNERSALAVTRALGIQQLEVIVGAETRLSLAAVSKYCSRSFVYPSPYSDPDSFVEKLLEIVEREQITIVFPISDIAMQLIGTEKSRFERYAVVPAPPSTVFEEVSNKYRLMKLALELQIPIPETIFVPDGRVQEIVDRISHFPVVVKPGQSVMKVTNGWSKTSVHYAANASELFNLYREKDYLRQPSLIQRRVNGEGQGLFLLMNRGEPLILFAHRRLREKPPSGGVSVLRESIDLHKPMAGYAIRLLQHIGWHGVAMVEFKVDRETEVPILMEINGRFWGSLQLALDAGLNFPYLLYQMATGQRMSLRVDGYSVGVKSRWLLGDLDHLLVRLCHSNQALCLPSDSPSKWKCLREFCKFYQPGLYYEIERLDDPRPCLYELRQYLKNLLGQMRMAERIRRVASILRASLSAMSKQAVRLSVPLLSWMYRRNGEVERRFPKRVQHVLFVCKGNVCRSPLAEAYLSSRLKQHGSHVSIKSAGLETSLGTPAHPLAKLVAQNEGVSLENHNTKPLIRELVDEADLILVMEWSQRNKLINLYPDARQKVFLMNQFNDTASLDIADPYNGTIADFSKCFQEIRQSCDKLFSRLMAS